MTAKAKDVYGAIDELADELGTAESHRQELVQEINDIESEMEALDELADAASSRAEFDEITAQREEARLDLRFAKNRLRLFDQSPRIDPETLDDIMAQLSAEIDAAAQSFRKKVEKPVAQIVAAGDEFDATVGRVRKAVSRLGAVEGPVMFSDYAVRWKFERFSENRLYQQAFTDGSTVRPAFRDALRLASSAKQEPFDAR